MKAWSFIINILSALAAAFVCNSFYLVFEKPLALCAIIPIFLLINIFGGSILKTGIKRLKICYHGAVMLFIFCFSVIVSIAYQIYAAFTVIPENGIWRYVFGVAFCIIFEAIIFWNGIISVYCSSVQLGIKLRVAGIICGMIPIANLVALSFIIKTVVHEIEFETAKEQLNISRKEKQICKTKYPLLLVHGVFFRDSNFFNYWGRIPAELEKNGALCFYGEQPSAASVKESGEFLAERIKSITEQTGCEKLNIIAHSKGGLDCRYALSHCGIADRVASLTTVNTPHKGCLFADYLLSKISAPLKEKVAKTYNTALKGFGEKDADFLKAVNDLTYERCEAFNESTPMVEGVLCRSVGSVLRHGASGKFPLNFSYHIARHFSGRNDGLVSLDSFEWGESFTLLEPSGTRGISHGDMIDLNRENIEGFDVREFYVGLVNGLKEKGL